VLGERIRQLGERRKGFVVTSDYIGPDRRRTPRPGDPPCLEAPNPLKLRALDTATDEEIGRLIIESVVAGRDQLNRERLRRDAVQLCVQSRMLERRHPGALDFGEILVRIGRLAAEMRVRASLIRNHAVPQWCEIIEQSIGTLIEQTRGADPAKLKDAAWKGPLSRLGQAALSLGQLLAPADVQPARLVELDDLVSQRTARSAAA
jgi:hypothetical protein